MMNKNLTVYATSDLHGDLPEHHRIPECDVFIIAGDSCPWQTSHDIITQSNWLKQVFVPWINGVKTKAHKVILIAGNHDFVMQHKDFKFWANENLFCDYLQDESMTYKGLNIHGTPWVPRLRNWAFYGDEEKLINQFNLIKNDVDILVSHGPPMGVNDALAGKTYGEHVGCEELALKFQARERIGNPIPINIHGHIHEGYGYTEQWGSKLYNVSHMDCDYQPVNDIVNIQL